MIHNTAIIHPGAHIGANVSIGAYSIIGEHVEIGDDTWVGPHVVINGRTRIGKGNRFFQFASIGEIPQDMKYAGEPTRLVIGDRNTFRECCTIHLGTVQDQGLTQIGNDNLIMAYVHVAHDCQLGDHIICANSVNLAGHVLVGDWAILGGFSGVHQFCRIGAHSFCAAGAIVLQDLPPYVTCAGSPAAPHGINAEGLKRRGFSSDAILAIKRAYKLLYRSGLSLDEARQQIAQGVASAPALGIFSEFIQNSGRGILR